MLNECLTVMVSRPEISPKTLLNIRNPQKCLNEDAVDGDARLKTPNPLTDIKIYGTCLSLTKLLHVVPLILLSVDASIMALVVSSRPVLRMLSTGVDVCPYME